MSLFSSLLHTGCKRLRAGVEYEDLYNWLKEKALEIDTAWKNVLTSRHIFDIAHKHALLATKINFKIASASNEDGVQPMYVIEEDEIDEDLQKVIDVDGFRAFLVHLFALCTLWVHFKSADEWIEGDDVGNESLNLDEFRLACRTLNISQSNHTGLSVAQIDSDFKMLDANNDGSVDFTEVRMESID